MTPPVGGSPTGPKAGEQGSLVTTAGPISHPGLICPGLRSLQEIHHQLRSRGQVGKLGCSSGRDSVSWSLEDEGGGPS